MAILITLNIPLLYRRSKRNSSIISMCLLTWRYEPASVAHLDARPTGDQEIEGSTPAGLAQFPTKFMINGTILILM